MMFVIIKKTIMEDIHILKLLYKVDQLNLIWNADEGELV